MIRAENLGIRFGNRWIFRSLDFEVDLGQCLAILGPNGSGKSTLLRALAGLTRPSEGRCLWPEDDLRSCIGYAALDMALYPELTAEEHLLFTGALRGCAPRADELLSRVGLERARKVAGEHLSTGMRNRLKIAMALQPRPEILLLDEPGASLDGEGRALVSEICADQMQRGCVIIATNDPAEHLLATHELNLDI